MNGSCCICKKGYDLARTESTIFCLPCCHSIARTPINEVDTIPTFDVSVCKKCVKTKKFKKFFEATKQRHKEFYHPIIVSVDLV